MTPLFRHIEELRETQQKLNALTKLINSSDFDILGRSFSDYVKDEYDGILERQSDLYDTILVDLGLHPLEDRHRLEEFIVL